MSVSPISNRAAAHTAGRRPRAIVYCEANLGEIDGKTANGLVRHSERYEIISVIDRTQAGRDAGEVLDGTRNGIPCCRDLDEALAEAGCPPELFIVGVAPTSGLLKANERAVLLDAMTYVSSTAILRGSRPAAVILQHAPSRKMISDFPVFPMPTPASEINLIETFADTTVIGLTINHENMTDSEVSAAIALYEIELGIPATDALTRPVERLLDMVFAAFPDLQPSAVAAR